MKVKTSELTGPALAYAVELANGGIPGSPDMALYLFTSRRVKPDSDWSQGGPIIEREGIAIYGDWYATMVEKTYEGATPLIAAMRCYVASQLGAEVEIPEELKGEGK
jgi:hypothetical protein